MIIGIIMVLIIGGVILIMVGENSFNSGISFSGLIAIVLAFIVFIIGCVNGFVYHPATEGTHIGIVTAIDLEGVYFRRWEVYLKSDGFEYSDGKVSNETKYLLYENETKIVEQLREYQGKKVKLYYGFEGGYIRWNSCGTYHITKVELLEEE